MKRILEQGSTDFNNEKIAKNQIKELDKKSIIEYVPKKIKEL